MQDLLLDENFELQIVNGDLVLDESDSQNHQIIIKANKGNLLQYPTLGVGIDQFLNGTLENYFVKIKKDIKVNFEQDNYELTKLVITGNELDFDAKVK